MEAINDSLKNIANASSLIKEFLVKNDIYLDMLLQESLVLLQKSTDVLSKLT